MASVDAVADSLAAPSEQDVEALPEVDGPALDPRGSNPAAAVGSPDSTDSEPVAQGSLARPARTPAGRLGILHQGQPSAPPNEFTFGWSDVDWDDSEEVRMASGERAPLIPRRAHSVRDSHTDAPDNDPSLGSRAVSSSGSGSRLRASASPTRPIQPRGSEPQVGDAPLPQVPALARQLAEQAAHTEDRVGATGLIAAATAVVLDSASTMDTSLQRLASRIIRAAAWIAWRLHAHPRKRDHLVLLPQSIHQCSADLLTRTHQGETLSTPLIANVLYRQMQELSAAALARDAVKPAPQRVSPSQRRQRPEHHNLWVEKR